MTIYEIILCVIGVWFIFTSLIMKTNNIQSAIIAKAILFFSGSYCIFFALYNSGIVRIG